MTLIGQVHPGAAAASRAHRISAADVFSVILVLAVAVAGGISLRYSVAQYWRQQAEIADFSARQIPGPVVPPLFDRIGHEKIIDEVAGGIFTLLVEIGLIQLFKRQETTARRSERRLRRIIARQQRRTAASARPIRVRPIRVRPIRVGPIRVEERWRPAPGAALPAAAADRASAVVWGDRVARHQLPPGGSGLGDEAAAATHAPAVLEVVAAE